MATTIDELNVVITANKEQMTKALNQLAGEVNGIKKQTENATSGMGSVFKKLAGVIAGAGIGKAIQMSLSVGMEAIETASLFTTTLGSEMATEVNEWTMRVSSALGLSNTELQRNIGVMYNIASAMGVSSSNSIKMSKGITMLAQDMASFYNMSPDEAFNKLRSAMVGVNKGLNDIGIKVDADYVKQVAYAKGIAEVGAELTDEQLTLARYEAILERTSAAQGDLGRTLESPANQTRVFKNNIQELWLALSRFLIPAYQFLITIVNQVVSAVTRVINAFANLFGLSTTNKIEQGVASSVQGVSAGLGDANNQAKKLKGTLAGFDEMNVLQDQNSGGSGGASAGIGGGSGYELGEYALDLDKIEEKMAGLSTIGSFIEGILTKALEPVANVIAYVKENWPAISEMIVTKVGEVVTFLSDNWPTIAAILAGVGTALLVWNGYFAALNLIPRIIAIKDTIGTMASGAIQNFQKLWGVIAANPIMAVIAVVAGLVAAFITAYKTNDEFREKVDTAWAAIKSAISNTIEKVKAKFEELKAKVTSIATTIKNAFGTAGELFKGFKEGLENVFKKVVNSMIKGINTVISWPLQKINTMLNKVRSTEILGFSPFMNLWGYNPISIPQIPMLERGGILKKGQIGLLEGNGAEAVVPLERTEWIDKIAEKLGGDGQPIQVVVKIGESTIVDKIIDGINEKTYRTGRAVISV